MDDQCNMRIYQEHLDEEIWKIVATNRDELVKLISCLKGNELVMPSLVGVVDEDSSSNSMPPKVDALQNVIGNGNQNGHNEANESKVPATKENVPNLKIKLNNDGASTVEQINPTVEKENYDENEDDSNISEIDESSQAASESSATTVGTKSTVIIQRTSNLNFIKFQHNFIFFCRKHKTQNDIHCWHQSHHQTNQSIEFPAQIHEKKSMIKLKIKHGHQINEI